MASSNSYSVPSSWTRRNLLSSFEKDIRSSASNSEGSMGKDEDAASRSGGEAMIYVGKVVERVDVCS